MPFFSWVQDGYCHADLQLLQGSVKLLGQEQTACVLRLEQVRHQVQILDPWHVNYCLMLAVLWLLPGKFPSYPKLLQPQQQGTSALSYICVHIAVAHGALPCLCIGTAQKLGQILVLPWVMARKGTSKGVPVSCSVCCLLLPSPVTFLETQNQEVFTILPEILMQKVEQPFQIFFSCTTA